MPGKKDNTLLIVIAAAIAAGIYLITKKPVTVTPQAAPVAPANNTLSYITPVESGVSDIISNLSVSSTVTPAPAVAPLQLTPPDSATLEPMNLDLIQRPGQSEDEESIES
jgi:hypothetical protein